MSDDVDVPAALDLPDLGSIALRLSDGTPAFVVRLGEGFVAYRNLCPHWGVDLDLGFGDFVDPRTGRIACRNHGAEFEVASGVCVFGPCAGDALPRLRVTVEDGRVRVGHEDAP